MLKERQRYGCFWQKHLLEVFKLFLMTSVIAHIQMGIPGVKLPYSERVVHWLYGITAIIVSSRTEENVFG